MHFLVQQSRTFWSFFRGLAFDFVAIEVRGQPSVRDWVLHEVSWRTIGSSTVLLPPERKKYLKYLKISQIFQNILEYSILLPPVKKKDSFAVLIWWFTFDRKLILIWNWIIIDYFENSPWSLLAVCIWKTQWRKMVELGTWLLLLL